MQMVTELCKIPRETSPLNIVFLDTLHHYAGISYSYLQKNLVDNVIITDFNSGHPYDKSKLDSYINDEIYLCGGYNMGCLHSTISSLIATYNKQKQYSGDQLSIQIVKDLTLESPKNMGASIYVDRVFGVEEKDHLTLNEFKERCNLISNLV